MTTRIAKAIVSDAAPATTARVFTSTPCDQDIRGVQPHWCRARRAAGPPPPPPRPRPQQAAAARRGAGRRAPRLERLCGAPGRLPRGDARHEAAVGEDHPRPVVRKDGHCRGGWCVFVCGWGGGRSGATLARAGPCCAQRAARAAAHPGRSPARSAARRSAAPRPPAAGAGPARSARTRAPARRSLRRQVPRSTKTAGGRSRRCRRPAPPPPARRARARLPRHPTSRPPLGVVVVVAPRNRALGRAESPGSQI